MSSAGPTCELHHAVGPVGVALPGSTLRAPPWRAFQNALMCSNDRSEQHPLSPAAHSCRTTHRFGDSTTANRQSMAADAHWGVAVASEYYNTVHKRHGIDGNGRQLSVRVYISLNGDRNNAFYSPSASPTQGLNFAAGTNPGNRCAIQACARVHLLACARNNGTLLNCRDGPHVGVLEMGSPANPGCCRGFPST